MKTIVTGGVGDDWSYFTNHKTLVIALITDFDPRMAVREHTSGPSRGAQPQPIMDALIWNQTAFHKAINLSTPPYVAS